MEYWGNAVEGRGLLFYDHTELQVVDDDDDYHSNISNPRKSVNEWDTMKPLSDFDKNIINPNEKAIDDIDLTESAFPEIITNSPSSEPSLGCLATEISNDSCKAVSSLLGELEFGSKSSNGKLPCRTELKFKGLADSGEIKINKLSKDSLNSSSVPAKRARKETLCAPVYVCQVYGCNKDLSSSKEYYKRHKVCDTHSKTSKVFINGIEKRFCQQCSRFHLLDEFDDGKRSCRKRLAGHNARRRKPTVVTCYGKSNQLIQYCQGSQKNGGKSWVDDQESSMSIFSNTSRALSLLSADEWKNFSPRSSACIPVPRVMAPPYHNSHRCLHHQSSSSSSSSAAAAAAAIGQSYSSSTGPYFDWLGTHMVPNSGVSRRMESINGGAATVDLNQLSAHLQRVERQKNYVLVKPENDLFN